MEKYNELLKSLESVNNEPETCDRSIIKQTAEAIQTLQSAIDEKQRLLDEALSDLAKGHDCKNCSNIDRCSIRRIERNLAYGGCSSWQWKGLKTEEIAS